VSATIWVSDNNQIAGYFAFSGENLIHGRIWTVVTGIFLHSNLTHLLGNMIFLYIFGNTLENELGEKWVIIPFLVGGIASFLLSSLFYDPTVYMVGASAAIFSLTAIVMLLKPLKFSFYFLMPLGLVAMIYFFFNLVSVYIGSMGTVSYIGHVIGFGIGVPFGIASSKNWHKNLLITAGMFTIYFVIVYFLVPSIVSNFFN
jgi:membrane associated rhomboid family serine protease